MSAGEHRQGSCTLATAPARRRVTAVVTSAPVTGDPVFAAFCAAGLWPGKRRTAADLPAAGITSPDAVTADRLTKLPKVGRQRAERLFSQLPGGRTHLRGGRAARGRRTGRQARRRRRHARSGCRAPPARRPVGCSSLSGVTLGDADRLAIAVLKGADRQDTRRGGRSSASRCGRRPATGTPCCPPTWWWRRCRPRASATRWPPSWPRSSRRRAGARAAGAEEPDAEPDPALRTLSLARYGMAEELVAEAVARLTATAERIADPASVRSVAKGWKGAGRGGRAGAGRRGQPAHRRPGHRQEPHGGRDRKLLRAKGTTSRSPRRPAAPPSGWRS